MTSQDGTRPPDHVGRKPLTCPLTGARVTCESCMEALYAYAEGEADERLAAVMEEHFRDCPSCAVMRENYREIIRAAGSLPGAPGRGGAGGGPAGR